MTTKSPLATAAAAFEHDLNRYDDVARELSSLALDSQKQLSKATRLLEEAATCEGRLAHDVEQFMTAMKEARRRQEDASQKTLDVAKRIEGRMSQHAALMQRSVALGERAHRATDPIPELLADEAVVADAASFARRLGAAKGELDTVLAETSAVIEEAQTAGFRDVAREADALRQKVLTTRNRVATLQRKVAERAPA